MSSNNKKDKFFNDIDKIPSSNPYKKFFKLQKQKMMNFSNKSKFSNKLQGVDKFSKR